MSVTKIEFEEKERAVELPGGEVLDLPQRTKGINDKLQELEKKRVNMNEFDFLAESLTTIFGKEGFKKIAPNGNKENLDYLSKVYRVSVNLIFADKLEAEAEEIERNFERLDPILDKTKAVQPLLKVPK